MHLKHVAVLFGALAMACTSADQYSSKSYSAVTQCGAGACTGTAPSAYVDGGFSTGASLTSVNGFRVTLEASSGKVIDDGGTVDCYYCDGTAQTCYKNPQLTQGVTGNGLRGVVFADFAVTFISGDHDAVACIPVGVGVLGGDGGTLTTKIYTHNERYK